MVKLHPSRRSARRCPTESYPVRMWHIYAGTRISHLLEIHQNPRSRLYLPKLRVAG